jgi:hypothetical protein
LSGQALDLSELGVLQQDLQPLSHECESELRIPLSKASLQPFAPLPCLWEHDAR